MNIFNADKSSRMFAVYPYEGIGIGLASTIWGCVAAALVPVPVAFYFYGAKLRERSRFAPTSKPQNDTHDEEKAG